MRLHRWEVSVLGSSRWLGLWVGLLLSLVAPISSAKKGKDRTSGEGMGLADRARSLRQQGISALAVKDFTGAADLLSQAYRVSPDADTLYQLGRLAWQSGRTVAAQDLMRRYLADPASSQEAAAKKDAEQIVEQPRPPSGEVTIVGERGALVLVDERVSGMLPLPLPLLLTSGEHRVTLEIGQRRIEGPVKVLPGRLSELRFNVNSDAVVSRVVPAVVWLPDYKGVPSEAQRLLSQTIEQAVRKQRLSVVPKGVALAQAPRLADCLEQLDCQDKLTTVNEADYLLATSVEAAGDLAQSDWTLRLSLVEASTGDYAAKLSEPCTRCSADQAGTTLDSLVVRLLREGMARPRGILEVLSTPPGADIFLTERKLGQAPYQRAALAGSYSLVVKQAGYRLHKETVVVEEGKKATLRVELVSEAEPVKPPPPVVVAPPPPPPVVVLTRSPSAGEREPRPLWRLALGASLIGAGLVVGGFGVSGLVQHGRPADPEGKTYFDTQDKGIALLSVGGLMAVGGTVLILIPGPRIK
jgi:hypothetical protein